MEGGGLTSIICFPSDARQGGQRIFTRRPSLLSVGILVSVGAVVGADCLRLYVGFQAKIRMNDAEQFFLTVIITSGDAIAHQRKVGRVSFAHVPVL